MHWGCRFHRAPPVERPRHSWGWSTPWEHSTFNSEGRESGQKGFRDLTTACGSIQVTQVIRYLCIKAHVSGRLLALKNDVQMQT